VQLLRDGGVDAASPAAIAVRAGASKMSLYRHFEGKDEILVEALGGYERTQRARLLPEYFGAEPPTREADPIDQILAMFADAADRADQPGFTGCIYVSTRLQLEAAHPAGEIAREHKAGMRAALADLLAAATAPEPARTAATVQMLYDGALVHCLIEGTGAPMRMARAAVAGMIKGERA
jgi:AcrR family transcriptional regulator